jgi:hypothetical protein
MSEQLQKIAHVRVFRMDTCVCSEQLQKIARACVPNGLGGWWLVEVSLSQFLPFYLTQLMRHVVRDNVEINHIIICDFSIFYE